MELFRSPVAVAVDFSGNIYVADAGNHFKFIHDQKFTFNRYGSFTTQWGGSNGYSSGLFTLPGAVAIGPDNNVFVTDVRTSRIQRVTSNGTFLGSWGTLSSSTRASLAPADNESLTLAGIGTNWNWGDSHFGSLLLFVADQSAGLVSVFFGKSCSYSISSNCKSVLLSC